MELKNKIIVSVVILVAAIFFFFKIVTLFEKDTEKIRRIVHSSKTSTEKEDLLKCISYISMDYNDKDGNDRASLFLIGKNVFQNYNDILIIIEDLNINIESNLKAIAHIRASGQGKRFTGEKSEYILDTAKVEFEIIFNKEKNKWKVIELKFIEPDNFLKLLSGL